MRKTRSTKLNALVLENRITPAITFNTSGGNLMVTGDNGSNTILVTGTAGNAKVYSVPQDKFTAYAANPVATLASLETLANFKVSLALTGFVNIQTGNSNDFVLFVIDDGGSLPGKVTVGMGIGNDDVIFQTRNNLKASVAGQTQLSGGQGADNFFLDDFDFLNTLQVDGGPSGVRNDATTNGPNPNDVFETRDVSVANLVSVTNAITFLGQVDGLGTTFHKGLVVTDGIANAQGKYSIDGFDFFATLGKKYSGLLAVGPLSTVQGNVVFQGSANADGFYNFGTITGNVTVSAQGGANDSAVGSAAPQASIGLINGNLMVIGANGVDSFNFFDGSKVSGNVSLIVGDGANLYGLNHTFTIGGSFFVMAGNQNDNMGTISGSIGTNENLLLGNGNNTVVLAGTVGGDTNYGNANGGGGIDFVTLAGKYHRFTGNFGAGNDTFTYNAGSSLTSFYGDFGAGTDTYDDSAVAPTSWPVTLINVP
jgi:hypothetical protein